MEINIDQYEEFKVESLYGRYITNDSILKFKDLFSYSILGTSENNNPIYYFKLGSGKKKILIWSQMHGNESTSTRALFDALSYFRNIDKECLSIVSIHIIPILNPDGALLYSRENFNKVDLNRDAKSLSQKESIVLKNLYKDIKPHYCFNLHDQRSIYSVSNSKKPSILSFLSPSADLLKSETDSRIVSMKIITSIAKSLNNLIPGSYSRYKDDFNSNCVGDTFQSLNTPTLLFESGHFENDYMRENTRKYMCFALIFSIKSITNNSYKSLNHKDYYEIPENSSFLTDVFLRNVKVKLADKIIRTNVSIMYEEILDVDLKKIILKPFIENHGLLFNTFGHTDLNFNKIEKPFVLNENSISELMFYVDKLRIVQ
tara:strand:+ start:449 stop:1567 length:1119 start_codon:yes stop_codon:yes gene_type:complete